MMVGAVTIGLWLGIAAMTWDGLRWAAYGALVFAAVRAWLWVRQLRYVFAADDEED